MSADCPPDTLKLLHALGEQCILGRERRQTTTGLFVKKSFQRLKKYFAKKVKKKRCEKYFGKKVLNK